MKKVMIGGAILTIFMLVVIFALYPNLPSQIPTHWNLHEIDGYGDKVYIFMYPAIIIGMNALMLAVPYLDPKKQNYKKFNQTYISFIWMIDIFFFLFFCCLLYSIFNPESVDMNMFAQLFFGVLIACMGNLMPRVRQNYFIGIKTPWVLADERVWNKTHRFSGRLWFGGGIFLFISALLPITSLWLNIFVFIILIVIPLIYSYVVYKKLNKKEKIYD